MEILGDKLFSLAKIVLPFESSGSSFIYNVKLLEQVNRYRSYNTNGDGPDIIVDEKIPQNGKADIIWILIHAAIFWLILMVLIEWRVLCYCYHPDSRMKQVTFEDNEAFFGKADDENRNGENEFDEGESSEVA